MALKSKLVKKASIYWRKVVNVAKVHQTTVAFGLAFLAEVDFKDYIILEI